MLVAMFETLHTWEMGLLEKLQHIKTEGLNAFFMRLNFFDSDPFYLLVMVLVWGLFGKKWGVRAVYLVLLSGLVNAWAKDFFAEPRPSHLMPELGLIKNISFGFPSGAAQTHIVLAGLGMMAWPRLVPMLCFLGFFLLVSFSRIYLGAHFISDVVGGWVIGGMLLFAYVRYHDRLEKWAEGLSSKNALWASFFIPLLLLLPYIIPKTIVYTSILFGVNIGLWLGCYVPKAALEPLSGFTTKALYIILAYLGAICLMLATMKLHSNFPALVGAVYVLLGLWLSWGLQRFLNIRSGLIRQ